MTAYPFAAVTGQSEMKLALLLAAVDWRLGVLLRGDKGSGKTTAARALAALLPAPAPFINLPIGATEDRLLGGLHLERTLKGDPALKPGLLAEAHGGVLYVDEVNLLAPHLGDALLDTAAGGVLYVEREGLSATHPAEFVLLGSMNPEEGTLRPQLLDRFALSVMVHAPADPGERQVVLERRIAFERDPCAFAVGWQGEQQELQRTIAAARGLRSEVACPGARMQQISAAVCAQGVGSLRADLAAVRAAMAYAALCGESVVQQEHVCAVLPLVLAHRARESARPQRSAPPPPQQAAPPQGGEEPPSRDERTPPDALERIFPTRAAAAPALAARNEAAAERGTQAFRGGAEGGGPVIGSRPSTAPAELDLRATLSHVVRETGSVTVRREDLAERVRSPRQGRRYLFVIDSSGSHAAQQRMRAVKGAVAAMLGRSFRRGDEVVLVVFRGTSAQVVLEPCDRLDEALAALDYLPTGGRTPLAAGLACAHGLVDAATLLVLLTDGRANLPLTTGDAWQDALTVARTIRCHALVVDTALPQQSGECAQLAEALDAQLVKLEELAQMERMMLGLPR